jgi:hypothetical protein
LQKGRVFEEVISHGGAREAGADDEDVYFVRKSGRALVIRQLGVGILEPI